MTGVRKFEPPVNDGTDECYGFTIIDPSNFSLVWIDTSRRKPTIDTVRVVETAGVRVERKVQGRGIRPALRTLAGFVPGRDADGSRPPLAAAKNSGKRSGA